MIVLVDKVSKLDVRCPECGTCNVQKKGVRKNKRERIQKYQCKKCRRYFSIKKMLNKSYPTNVILNAVSFYNKGMTLEDASKKINMKFGVKTYPRLISAWMKEFSNICTFRRFRKKISEGKRSGFPNPIIEKLIEHKQPYLYKYHKLKMDIFLNEYFKGLKDYLLNVFKVCPHELFLKDNIRSSQVKISGRLSRDVGVEKKNNYACKLADLALKMAKTNKERHKIVQDFMLVNDTSTLAAEVPIWLTKEEVREINSKFKIFSDVKANSDVKIKDKEDDKNGEKDEKYRDKKYEDDIDEITGHIDLVQARYGLIYVLDYKPESKRVDAISQLFTYALALSIRTNVWLRNFRCAWFDDKEYYEFNPNDIILGVISGYVDGDGSGCDSSGVGANVSEKERIKYEKEKRKYVLDWILDWKDWGTGSVLSEESEKTGGKKIGRGKVSSKAGGGNAGRDNAGMVKVGGDNAGRMVDGKKISGWKNSKGAKGAKGDDSGEDSKDDDSKGNETKGDEIFQKRER